MDIGNELLSLFVDDAKWLQDAAAYFENTAQALPEGERPEWERASSVYRDRAEKYRALIKRMLRGSAQRNSPTAA
jgi:hypothetical protein